jgi:sugar phosphate isomerase/epimerase
MLCYSTGSLPDTCTLADQASTMVSRVAYWLLPTPFRGVEWVIRPEHLRRSADKSFWNAVHTGFETRGFLIRNVHLGYPYLLSDKAHQPGFGSLIPHQSLCRTEAALAAARIAEALGSPHLTITSGPSERSGGFPIAPGDAFAKPMPPMAQGALSPDFVGQWQVFRQQLGRLVRERPKTVDILLEPEPEMVLHSAWQLAVLCHEWPGEVFANYDIGHGHVLGENLAQCLHNLGPYLRNLHIEDMVRPIHQHLLFGQGDIDFSAVFAALKAMPYAGDITPDLYPFSEIPKVGLQSAIEFLAFQGWH